MAVQTQIQTRRGTAASWTSTNPTLAAGEIGFETDTGKFKIGNGSTAWASLAYSAGATAVTYLFNATGGQTTFSGTDANGLTLAYTVGAEQVYLNGVLQVRGSDYTATNGTSIVLASGALVSDVLNVIAYSAMTITDTYTQAQADAKFFQTANAFLAGKNKIINGDFSVWQRGTSFTTVNTYTADRYSSSFDGTGGTRTVSQQTFTPGTAPVAGYEGQYFWRYNKSVGGSGGTIDYVINQKIEDVRTLAGQTVTFSFWAKAASSITANVFVSQNFGSGGSSAVNLGYNSVALTTSWQRFTFTYNLGALTGKTIGTNSYLMFNMYYANTNATFTIDTWGWQVEAGSIATSFQTATGTIQGELAACQRYYESFTNGGELNGFYIAVGYTRNTTDTRSVYNYFVQKRVAPTVTLPAGTDFSIDFAATTSAATSASALRPSIKSFTAAVSTTAVLTAGQAMTLRWNNSTTSLIEISAEL
jgi:hypothetical protein